MVNSSPGVSVSSAVRILLKGHMVLALRLVDDDESLLSGKDDANNTNVTDVTGTPLPILHPFRKAFKLFKSCSSLLRPA